MRLRFSLRFLLSMVTLFSLFCGFILRPTLGQRRIVNSLEKAGAIVTYDHNDRWGLFSQVISERNKTWLDRLAGMDLMHTATSIHCYGNCNFDAVLQLAGRLPTIDSINFATCDVEDRHLAELRSWRHLKDLRLDVYGAFTSMSIWREGQLRAPHISDAGLAHLANLPALERLSLASRSSVTDAGMIHLGKLPSLHSLNIQCTSVTGAGLVYLQNLGSLEELNLWYCEEVNDEGMKSVAALKSLRRLDLGFTKITDKGLAELQDLQSLEELELQSCLVTDEGMNYVGKLTSLRRLSLYDTKVTDVGLRRLIPIGELETINLNDCGVTQAGVEETAQHLHVGQWAIPQEWRDKVRAPKGQTIYGVPETP